ncbi:MAG: helix-turn-helix domain-containing protein [Halioglobus sp.]|nr:helix-turn-helix domain-containing protein [Halioglobus sp.]
MAENDNGSENLLEALVKLTGQVAGGTLDLARNTATMTAMFGESWLRNALVNRFEPERLEAMAEAGRFLRDARELAGLSIKELADSLGLSDRKVLEDIESGEQIMPLELMLRSASLLARHDPIPFLIKFMRTYNPALEQTLEQWGVMVLPRQYERERRFVNLVRQHDELRGLTDDEYDRFMHYMDSSLNLVLEVMLKEKEIGAAAGKSKKRAEPKARPRARPKGGASPTAKPKKRAPSTKKAKAGGTRGKSTAKKSGG